MSFPGLTGEAVQSTYKKTVSTQSGSRFKYKVCPVLPDSDMLILCSKEKEREENQNTAKKHDDVAEHVHVFNLLEIIENDSNQI